MLGEILQFVIAGIAVGSAYGMAALGLVIIFNVTGVINFAQGVFPMLGGLLMVSLVNHQVPVPIALAVCFVALGVAGALYSAVIVLPFKPPSMAPFIAALGAAIATQGVALLIWGYDPLAYEPFSGSQALYFMGAAVYPQALWVIGAACVLLAVTQLFFEHTYLGKAVRACSLSRQGAQVIGVEVRTMAVLAFALSGAVCGVLGAIVTPLTSMSFTSDISYSLNAFAAAVFGGLTRPLAAYAGAIALGVVGALCQAYLGKGYDLAATLALMLGVLILRPQGVFHGLFVRKGAS